MIKAILCGHFLLLSNTAQAPWWLNAQHWKWLFRCSPLGIFIKFRLNLILVLSSKNFDCIFYTFKFKQKMIFLPLGPSCLLNFNLKQLRKLRESEVKSFSCKLFSFKSSAYLCRALSFQQKRLISLQCMSILSSLISHAMASYSNFSLLFLLISATFSNHIAAKNRHTTTTNHHHHHHGIPKNATIHRLKQAYTALQAWKHVIYSDPSNFTSNWHGLNVCSYNGIYCAPHPNDTTALVIAGIDLNHRDIAGFLPEELGLLSDLALLHLNSNRFCGIIPQTFSNLALLFELDLSNNRFVGKFPSVILSLPSLHYLDIRFNEFEGQLPPQLFDKTLDAIFLNNNRFTSVIPQNLGSSSASVVVFANNRFSGCLPPSIAKFANTLEELLLINTSISGCLPIELGFLYKLKVLDVSFNQIVGTIPYSLTGLSKLEVLNLGHNEMSGIVPEGICVLPNLTNFTISYNYFCEEEGVCGNLTSKGIVFGDRKNCLPEKKFQRSKKECDAEKPVDCFENACGKSTMSSHFSLPSTSPP